MSTSSRATIGGMSANNSCGSRSLYYGNMVHNVLAIEAILDDGSLHTFDQINNNYLTTTNNQDRFYKIIDKFFEDSFKFMRVISNSLDFIELEIEDKSLDKLLTLSRVLFMLFLLDLTMEFNILLVSLKSEIVSEKSDTLVLKFDLVGSSKTELIFSRTLLALTIIISIFS